MGSPVIKAENFSYIYPNAGSRALSGLNFTVDRGDFVGIVGCNKAGKSTLCLAMVGVLPYMLGGQWDGSLFVDGHDLEESGGSFAATVTGIVFQDAESQFTQETVEDEIAFALCNFGYDRDLMEERVRTASAACGLFDMLDRSPFQLSGGQQQRLAIACILALKPAVIILDESTSQLDPAGRDEVFGLVKELHASGSTIIMVDHNIEKIAEYADKVLVMHQGRIVEYNDAPGVFKKQKELTQYGIRVPQVTAAALELGMDCKKRPPICLEEAVRLFRTAGAGS